MIDMVLEQINARSGGRLGVALLDSEGAMITGHRTTERFAMCSTFKAPLAAALLLAHDKGALDQFAPVTVTQDDLVPYAPFTERVIREGGTTNLRELAENTVDNSDNAAANIIMRALGGPPAMTQFFRDHGANTMQLDRWEPDLNTNVAGDLRDTTTPGAMAGLLHNLLIAQSIGARNAATLRQWMVQSATGKARIEAGIPAGWTMGDKTGTAPSSAPAYNDVAIIWPESGKNAGKPFILAVYLDRPDGDGDAADAAIADVARHAVLLLA